MADESFLAKTTGSDEGGRRGFGKPGLRPFHESEDGEEARPMSPLLHGRAQLAPSHSEDEKEDDDQAQVPPSATSGQLYRSSYMPILVLLYAGFALFAWCVTCILTERPITTAHYGLWTIEDDGRHGTGYPAWLEYFPDLFANNQRWYRAARTVQSIVSVLTIPLTSAVCSSAAVVFVQANSRSFGLTLRQVMTLADKGWSDPTTYLRTVFVSKGWKRYGSSFLLVAMFLNILGVLVSPLQQIFLSSTTIKIPTESLTVYSLLDIQNQVNTTTTKARDSNYVPIMARSAIGSATNTQPQALLWQGSGLACDAFSVTRSWGKYYGDYDTSIEGDDVMQAFGGPQLPMACGTGVTLGNMSSLGDPFLAELPSGYNTGLIRQFLPRFNSTASYEKISFADFPKNCNDTPGSFFVHYGNANYTLDDGTAGWNLQACMPSNQLQSPWKAVRTRQDFSEELFLNITLTGFPNIATTTNMTLFKITVATTAGHFELPNYMNNQTPGPLLSVDPKELCGADCELQGFWNNLTEESNIISPRENATYPSEGLLDVVNQGPLLTTAIALFGVGSFMESKVASPPTTHGEYSRLSNGLAGGPCTDLFPLTTLLLADGRSDAIEYEADEHCIPNPPGEQPGYEYIQAELALWLSKFQRADPKRVSNAFTGAAFLANKAWLLSSNNPEGNTLQVNYDLGADTERPVISRVGIAIISTLLALDLLALLFLAVYASIYPRWTSQLDSFAMMRIGAAMAGKEPLLVTQRTDAIKSLDEHPGWIGDTADPDESHGALGLGGSSALRIRRHYRSYEGHDRRFPWYKSFLGR